MSTSARHGMVLTLAVAIAWYCWPAPHLPQAARALQCTQQFLRQAERHPEQAWLWMLLKFEPLGDVFRRTL